MEDDRDLCALLEYNLAQRGYKVATVQRLAGAIDKVRDVSPDLILLDVMLPDGDGFTSCRELRADPALADVPALFLTARSEEADKVLGLELGGDEYITKPFSSRELVARVKAHLRRQGAATGHCGWRCLFLISKPARPPFGHRSWALRCWL